MDRPEDATRQPTQTKSNSSGEDANVPLAFSRGRWLLFSAILLAIGAFYALGLNETLSWSALRERQAELHAQIAERPVLCASAFFLLYVVVAGLALPITPVLSFTAGVLFGRWWGIVLVNLASTTGATLAFLSSRYLFRALVQRRYGDRLAALQREAAVGGAYYLMALRLMFVVPFSLVNVAMGLTPMRVWTFWWVSQLGMLPFSFLVVNAGAELSEIRSLEDLLSWQVLTALALLSVVPLVLRWTVRRWGNMAGILADGDSEHAPPG